MKAFVAAALAALCLATPALAKERAAPNFSVIEENASIPFAGHAITSYRIAEDDSLLLQAGGRWYRATVWRSCAHDLKFEEALGFDTGAVGSFDKFSTVIVNGRRCPIQSLDRIQPPPRRAG